MYLTTRKQNPIKGNTLKKIGGDTKQEKLVGRDYTPRVNLNFATQN